MKINALFPRHQVHQTTSLLLRQIQLTSYYSLHYSAHQLTRYNQPLNLRSSFVYLQNTASDNINSADHLEWTTNLSYFLQYISNGRSKLNCTIVRLAVTDP